MGAPRKVAVGGERGRRARGRAGIAARAPRWVLLLSVAGLVVIGILRMEKSAAEPVKTAAAPEHARPKRGVAAPRSADASRAVGGGERQSEPAPGLPPSLEGTEVDGGLDVGADGHLVLGPRVIALFDYFFSASGQEPDSVLRGRIARHARAHLSEPALGEALALLDRYSAYREAGRSLRTTASASPEERLAAVHDLRRAHFGDAAEALFGADERSAKAAIDRARVGADKTLSPDERADRLAEIDEQLPAAERQARSRAVSVAQLREDEAALRAAGADEAEIHRFRAGTLGDEATARLEALDRERAAWKERLDTFRRERDARCRGAGASACETALLQASFDEREQIRVRAISAGESVHPR